MKVILFQPRFAPLVKAGQKLQTIRPVRKRPVGVGDTLSLRQWSGLPYRSPQLLLRETQCTRTAEIILHRDPWQILVNRRALGIEECCAVAHADGFSGIQEMFEWFQATHDFPFHGHLIAWPPLPPRP